MVSSAILAAACLFLARSLNAAFAASRAAEDYYRASLLVENELWKIDQGYETSELPNELPIEPSAAAPGLPAGAQWRQYENHTDVGNLKTRTLTLSWGRKEYLDVSAYAAE